MNLNRVLINLHEGNTPCYFYCDNSTVNARKVYHRFYSISLGTVSLLSASFSRIIPMIYNKIPISL